MKNNDDFADILKSVPSFNLRRAMERLREGLFDPLGVKLLTTGDMDINHHFEAQTKNLDRGKAAHLCVCGAYGEGKSHTLNYIRQRALEENYAVSYINLDPREVPLHNLKQLYRSLMQNLTFPDEIADISEQNGSSPNANRNLNGNRTFVDIWKKRAREWLSIQENRNKSVEEMIPEMVSHRFRSILTAMAQHTATLPSGKRNLKKHSGFKPREFPHILNSAFLGKDIPVTQLRTALRYRQVSFYKEDSLTCKDDHLYLEAIQGYGALFQNMGYRGLVVLFDEAESVMLTPITRRSRSYSLLHEIFCPRIPIKGFFPVFAFTHDFFTHLKDEDFERTRIIRNRKIKSAEPILTDQTESSEALLDSTTQMPGKRGLIKKRGTATAEVLPEEESAPTANGAPDEKEVAFFEHNYSKAWQDIHIYSLRTLTSKEWHVLIRKLIQIHALAYRWEPDLDAMERIIFSRLLKQSEVESRMKLKLIVNLLDLEQQKRVISKDFIM